MPAGRPVKFDNDKKTLFLEKLAQYGIKSKAAKAVGVNHSTILRHIEKDPAFARAVEEALTEAADTFEDELIRRAVHGYEEPVFFNGVEVGKVRKYSDRLLDKLVTATKREKYGQQSTVNVEGRITHEVTLKAKENIMGNLERIIDSTCEEVQSLPEESQKTLPELQNDYLDMDVEQTEVLVENPKDNEQ